MTVSIRPPSFGGPFLAELRPAAPLSPRTHYTVVFVEPWGSSSGTRVCGSSGVSATSASAPSSGGGTACELPQLTRFTTGDTDDVTPPQFAGITGIGSWSQECDWGGCCGPYSDRIYSLGFMPAQDNTVLAGYRVYRDGNVVGPVGTITTGAVHCSGFENPQLANVFWAQSVNYALHAVDVADNEDANTAQLALVVTCDAGVALDASFPPDASSPPDVPPPPNAGARRAGSSCSCSTTDNAAATWILVALVVRRFRTAGAGPAR